MGVSALGNVTYINQNAPLNSAIQQGARSDMLDLAQSFQNKLELAQETRALENTQAISDKNSEEGSPKHYQSQQRSKAFELEEEEIELWHEEHLLDIVG
ncbi:hypothetical protein [Helicobacter cetorum]|uniref:Uncharacterized protein n=1 Tax=Helicobacter cetorum (strain ATCC BAA-540 / CCUG 52418 / MIT 99-5656) TaxID=1163745 RepID=I0ESM8_HELCM|nr:hypothetical protein [Helicobacter cetorum]AFI05947.1 hypothetical protein HCD_04715 [Helicobacter cetorum MIT 99-5656]